MPWSQIEATLVLAFTRRDQHGRVVAGNDLFGMTQELSDEELVVRWSENVVWQYFSGLAYYTPRLPCDAPQIGRFRTVIGEAGKELLKATIDAAEGVKNAAG